MSKSGVIHFFLFFVYAIAQVLLLKNLVLFNMAFCLVYVVFILLLPVETNNLLLMVAGFLLGLTIDIFYDSLGMHAMALVAVGYARNYWLGVITPQGGYDSGLPPTLASNGLQWFLIYSIPLLFLHHFILFFVEAGDFSRFGFTLLKVGTSLLFTLAVVLILQYFSLDRRR